MRSIIRITAALVLWACAAPAFGQARPSGPPARGASLQQFRDAKFGVLIHWGLYSVAAGEWNGRMVSGPGEWIMHNARIPAADYAQLASRFNPLHFNPEDWVKLAEEGGAKYVVFTAKHHDGFAMYHSDVSRYNVVDATPFHRDPVKELAAACVRHNLKLGLYYSQAQDWHEPNGDGNDWDFRPDNRKDFDAYLRSKAEPQIRELLTRYGPVFTFWFDTPLMMNARRARRFLDLVHSLQPAALINGRLGIPGDFSSVDDRHIPRGVVRSAWDTPDTINDTWGFKQYDNHWKSADDLIFRLVDVVSKGGNFLLNVGPTADGVIPQPAIVTLRAIGEWLKRNGEAIYGAGPTPFGSELASRQWRCTTRPGKLFITLFQWPDGPLELNEVKDKVTKAWLMTDEKHAAVEVTQTGGRVNVVLPKDPPIEGKPPERINLKLYIDSLRAHVQRVVVLETQHP